MHPIPHTFTALLVTILLGAARSNAVDWQPGDILATDFSARTLIKAKSNTVVDNGFNLNAPLALAFDGNGDIWVVDAPNRVLRIDHRSAAVTVIAENGMLQNVDGIAVAADGSVYVTEDDVIGPESEAGKVIRIASTTGAQTIIAADGYLIDPLGIVVGPDGNLYIADVYSQGGAVIRVDPATGEQKIVSTGSNFVTPVGLTFERTGTLVVTTRHGMDGPGSIVRVDPVSGTQTVLSAGGLLVDPFSVAVEPSGDLLVADVQGWGGIGAIIRVDPATGAQSDLITGSGLIDPVGIAIVPASVELACPCGGPTTSSDWTNHGQYVTCVSTATKQWVAEGLITAVTRPATLRQAAQSSCGCSPNHCDNQESVP